MVPSAPSPSSRGWQRTGPPWGSGRARWRAGTDGLSMGWWLSLAGEPRSSPWGGDGGGGRAHHRGGGRARRASLEAHQGKAPPSEADAGGRGGLGWHGCGRWWRARLVWDASHRVVVVGEVSMGPAATGSSAWPWRKLSVQPWEAGEKRRQNIHFDP